MPSFIGYGMRGFNDLNPLAWNCVAVARNNEAAERSRPCILDGFGHCRRGFACSNYDCLAFRWCRQMGRNANVRQCGGNRRIEHAPEQLAWLVGHEVDLLDTARERALVMNACFISAIVRTL